MIRWEQAVQQFVLNRKLRKTAILTAICHYLGGCFGSRSFPGNELVSNYQYGDEPSNNGNKTTIDNNGNT